VNAVTDDLLARVCAIVATTFGEPPARVTAASGNHSIAMWDSMNHLHLIVALEAEFGVSFAPELAVDLVSVEAIVAAVIAAKSAA
jgi:acyl carrier protein